MRLAVFAWHATTIAAFVVGSVQALIVPLLAPAIAGSHALVYTAAARAAIAGADPWTVGPPDVIYGGPPTMLLLFLPFTSRPEIAIRVLWIVGIALASWWVIRRLRMPLYWLLCPQIVSAIVLGHPEILVLALLLLPGPIAGLAAIIKPYAGLALLAQHRWRAIIVGLIVVGLTAPFLPWPRFIQELSMIGANLLRQDRGDSVFGDPVLTVVAALALSTFGLRRALWLATPILWPAAQPIYKIGSMPEVSPVLAIFWSLPLPGATLAGLIVDGAIRLIHRRQALPAWLLVGVRPIAQPIPSVTGAVA
jgi:hypothetical protein